MTSHNETVEEWEKIREDKYHETWRHPEHGERDINKELLYFILTADRTRRLEDLRNLWLDVQFLDKYSDDEHYWNSAKGSNHTVEMHISDFERLRKAINPEQDQLQQSPALKTEGETLIP